MWPILLDISKDECRGILRRLELEAYAGLLNAFRAQGTLGQRKREMLVQLRSVLHINADRHKAEIRRVTNDETLCTVSEQISGDNSRMDWLTEGRRTVPLIPRGRLETAYAALADSLAREAFMQNREIKVKPCTEVTRPKKYLPDHTNVVTNENRQVLPAVQRERTKIRRRNSTEVISNEIDNKQTQSTVNPRISQTVPVPPKVPIPSTSKSVPSTTVYHQERIKDHMRKKSSQVTTNAKIKQLYNSQNKVKSHPYQKHPPNTQSSKLTHVPQHAPKIKTNRGPNPQIPQPITPKVSSMRPPSHVRNIFEPSPANNITIKVEEQKVSRLSPNEQVSEDDNRLKQHQVKEPVRTIVSVAAQMQSNDKYHYVISPYQKVQVHKPPEEVKNVKIIPQQQSTNKPMLVQNISNNRIKQHPSLPNGKTVKLVSIALPNKVKPVTTLVPVSNAPGKVTISNSSFKPVTLQNVTSNNKFAKVQIDASKPNVIFLQKPKPGQNDVPIVVTKDGKEIKLMTPTDSMNKKEHMKPTNVILLDVANPQADKGAALAQILQASGVLPAKNEIIIKSSQPANSLENIIIEERLTDGNVGNKMVYSSRNKVQVENNVNTLNSTDWEEELDNASGNKYAIRNQNNMGKVKVIGYKANNGDQVLRIDENFSKNTGSQKHHETIVCLNPQDTFTIIKDKTDNASIMSDAELMNILNGSKEDSESSTTNLNCNYKSNDTTIQRQDIFQKALEQADIKLDSEEYLDENLDENIYVTERLQDGTSINDHIIYEPIQQHQSVEDSASNMIVEEEEIVIENYYVEQNMINADEETHTYNIDATDVEMSLMEVT